MLIRLAKAEDIPAVMELHTQFHLNTIRPEDLSDGFVTTSFTPEQLDRLITEERGLTLAEDDQKIVAYAMAASWNFWSQWPMFVYMMEGLPQLTYDGDQLTVENSYQYGPVCVSRPYRGSGLLQQLFEFSRHQMSQRFPYLVTFINKKNPRSFAAHTRKIGLEVISEFHYNDNDFYELASKAQ